MSVPPPSLLQHSGGSAPDTKIDPGIYIFSITELGSLRSGKKNYSGILSILRDL